MNVVEESFIGKGSPVVIPSDDDYGLASLWQDVLDFLLFGLESTHGVRVLRAMAPGFQAVADDSIGGRRAPQGSRGGKG